MGFLSLVKLSVHAAFICQVLIVLLFFPVVLGLEDKSRKHKKDGWQQIRSSEGKKNAL
jgi:hypothetical protein